MRFSQDDFLKNPKALITAVFGSLLLAGGLFLFRKDVGGRSFFLYACLVASYYAYHHINKKPWDKISRGVLIGLGTFMFVVLIVKTISAATSDAQWDFMCFYLQGKLGLHNLNFYDGNSFNVLMSQIGFHHPYDSEFKAEILDVGFLSPPITMLFYAPLSSLDYATSRIILSLAIFAFIIASAILANFVFVKDKRSIFSLLFIFIIIALLPGTGDTIFYNQTNFFILFFLLLMIHKIDKPVAGVYLALSLIIKPISGILILFFIAQKKWKQVISFCATGAFLLVVTGLIWGVHNIVGFIQSPPTRRLPQILYEQGINQSLIAVLNRNLKVYGLNHHIINLIFYLAVGILIVMTYFVSSKLSKVNQHVALFPFLLCMLMIYPSSLSHYMVDLIPLFIYFLLKRDNKYFWPVILFATAFLEPGVFYTYLTLWIFLLYSVFFSIKWNNNAEEKLAV